MAILGSISAMITLPRFEKDWLKFFYSVNLSPVAPDSLLRSEPVFKNKFSMDIQPNLGTVFEDLLVGGEMTFACIAASFRDIFLLSGIFFTILFVNLQCPTVSSFQKCKH
jgi:hypothetical protein